MHPTFHLGIDFPACFTLLMVGCTLVVRLAHRDAARWGIDGNHLLDLSLVLLAAGIIGARVLHVVADESFEDYVHLCTDPFQVRGEPLPGKGKCNTDADCARAPAGYEVCNPAAGTCHQARDCLRAFKFWYGGLAYYGGLFLAIGAGIWYIRRKRMPLWRVGVMAGYAIPLGLVFGRTGCWLAGCCFGDVADPPLGIAFPAHSPAWEQHVQQGLIPRAAAESLPVIPTQLMEAAACLAIFAYGFFQQRKRRRFDGQIFFTSMMWYAVARFAIEFFRDDPRGGLLGLATSQWLGIPLFVFAAYMYRRESRRESLRRAAAAPPPASPPVAQPPLA